MSYSIVYARTFIKTARGIIPLVLSGSNNCTHFQNGREVRDREWHIYNNQLLGLSEPNFMKTVNKMFAGCNGTDQLFVWHNKWVYGNQIEAWFRRGVREARPIEDILRINPGAVIIAHIAVTDRESLRVNRAFSAMLHTTDELDHWMEEARDEAEKLKSDNNSACVYMGFATPEPLKIPHPTHTEPVVAKFRGKYVEEVSSDRISCSADINDAIVFATAKEAEEQCSIWAKRYTIKYVKHSTVQTPKPYAIQMTSGKHAGLYILKRSSKKVYFTTHVDQARRFPTRQKAIAVIQDLVQYADNIGIATVVEIRT